MFPQKNFSFYIKFQEKLEFYLIVSQSTNICLKCSKFRDNKFSNKSGISLFRHIIQVKTDEK